MIDEKKLIERVYTGAKYQRCPSIECWEHSSKDCDKCTIKEISVADVITIAEALAKEYNNGWIPCRERLPELSIGGMYSEDMLVTLKWFDGDITESIAWINKYGKWSDESKNCEVIAWMPLPETYKGEE